MSSSNNPEVAAQPVVLALPTFAPSLAVEVLPYGFTIHRILVNAGGRTHDLVISHEDPTDHIKHRRFMNTIVGRYSNRIPAGEFTLEKNGVESHLSVAATESPLVSLHGGADGFDRRPFTVIHPGDTDSYSLFSDKEKQILQSTAPSSAVFKMSSHDGDQGFPGKLDVEVAIGLTLPGGAPIPQEGETELGSLFIIYRAKLSSDNDKKVVTPVNLTQHWGFNLDASLASPGQPMSDVKGQELTIKADNVIALQDNGLATGDLTAVAGTPHYHESKPIGESFPEGGYDSFYLFGGSEESQPAPSRLPLSELSRFDGLSSVVKSAPNALAPVELSSKQSGLRVSFETNQPGVQFYSGNFLDGSGSRKRVHGGSGQTDQGDGYEVGAGAYLEFHEPLAAWMHPWGQGDNAAGDTLLTSDEFYHNFVKLNVFYKPTELASE